MSIVGRNPAEIGLTREKVDLFHLSFAGQKLMAGAYYALAGSLSPNVQQADYYIVCGADKRLWELRFVVSPKLAAGKSMTVRLARSTDGGETFAPLGPAALALFLVPAVALFPVKLLALWLIHLGRTALGSAPDHHDSQETDHG